MAQFIGQSVYPSVHQCSDWDAFFRVKWGESASFKMFSLLVVLVFVGVGLFGLITSLGWLFTKKPMLEINKYEVVLRKQPWQEMRLPASKIISVRHQLAVTVDDIYEAVAKYLPHATWND